MKITEIETSVCIVQKETVVTSSKDYSFTPRQLAVNKEDSLYEVCLIGDTKIEKRILVDNYLQTGEISIEKQEKIICDAIAGYDVAIVFLSAGSDIGNMHYKRTCDLELILRALQKKITEKKNKIKVEYAYLSITDECCYDMRKNVAYTNKALCDKGIDFLMKRVDNVRDIWSHFEFTEEGRPFMLNIKLSDGKNLTQGRLVIIDLLYPTFSLLLTPNSQEEVLESSCVYLYDIVRKIKRLGRSESDSEEIPYLLAKELIPYISGSKKLLLCAYFQNVIDDEEGSVKIKVCLDFIHSLRGTRVVMLQNKLITNNYVEQKYYDEDRFEELISNYKTLKDHIKKKNSTLENLKKQVEVSEKINEQLNTSLNLIRNELEKHENKLSYVKTCHEEEIQKKNVQIKELLLKNEELLAALDKERSIILQIKNLADAIKYYKKQYN